MGLLLVNSVEYVRPCDPEQEHPLIRRTRIRIFHIRTAEWIGNSPLSGKLFRIADKIGWRLHVVPSELSPVLVAGLP